MTLSAGDYLLGAYTASGDLVVIPSRVPADGEYCVFARTGDHRPVAMLANPMRVEGAVGFLGTAADGLMVAFAPSAAGPALCIPVQSLGYGIPWMAYPPFSVDVNVTSVVPQTSPPRDAFIGAWADWLAGQPFGGGALTPEGIQRSWSILNLNMDAHYPFLEANPHDLEAGSPALSLGGMVPAANDGVWFHAEPMPLVMSRRTCIGPGPLHDPAYWPFQPTPGTASMGLPMDVRSTRQLFTNLKAWLDFTTGGDIRLNLRMYVVVMVGRTADFVFAPPIHVTYPSPFVVMNCIGDGLDLTATGIGTACQALTVWGGIPSLGCFCICEAIELSQCAELDFGINALRRSNEYYACGDYPNRRVRTIAVHGGDTRQVTAPWPYGQEPADVTEVRVLAAFGASGTINEWVAAEFASRFSASPLAIDNESNMDRLGTLIECDCAPTAMGTTVPDELAGTQPLPADDVTICFPEAGTPLAPVIPKVQLDNIDGWGGRAEQMFRYALTSVDAYASAKNPDLDDDLGLWYITNKKTAYRWLCALWASWEGLEARIPDILAGSVLTDLPLRTDCFANGYDVDAGEYVFGYDFPTNLYDPAGGTLDYCTVDLAQALVSVCGGTPLGDTDLIPPRDNPTAWALVGSGGGARTCPPVEPFVDCNMFPDHPYCDEDPDADPPLCRVLDEDWYWLRDTIAYPRYYLLKKPQVEVRVKFEGCYLTVRATYVNWLMRETSCWFDDGAGTTYWTADHGDNNPWMTGLGIIEVSRGAQVYLFGGTDMGGHFTGGILDSEWWRRNIGTGRLLGGCLAANPGYCTVAGENSLRVYL